MSFWRKLFGRTESQPISRGESQPTGYVVYLYFGDFSRARQYFDAVKARAHAITSATRVELRKGRYKPCVMVYFREYYSGSFDKFIKETYIEPDYCDHDGGSPDDQEGDVLDVFSPH